MRFDAANGRTGRSSGHRVGLVAGLVGPTVFVTVFLLEGLLRNGYDPLADYVSALSLGPRGWVQIANFLLVGACLLLFAGAYARSHPTGASSRAAPTLLRVIGAGYLLSGPFVMDPPGTPPAAASWHGLTHDILGAVVFVLMPIACFVLLRRIGREHGRRGLWWTVLTLAVTTAAADVVFTVATKMPALAAATASWAGLLQRLVIIPFMATVALVATHLLRRP